MSLSTSHQVISRQKECTAFAAFFRIRNVTSSHLRSYMNAMYLKSVKLFSHPTDVHDVLHSSSWSVLFVDETEFYLHRFRLCWNSFFESWSIHPVLVHLRQEGCSWRIHSCMDSKFRTPFTTEFKIARNHGRGIHRQWISVGHHFDVRAISQRGLQMVLKLLL